MGLSPSTVADSLSDFGGVPTSGRGRSRSPPFHFLLRLLCRDPTLHLLPPQGLPGNATRVVEGPGEEHGGCHVFCGGVRPRGINKARVLNTTWSFTSRRKRPEPDWSSSLLPARYNVRYCSDTRLGMWKPRRHGRRDDPSAAI